MQTITFRMDKQQGPTVQHRELYLISWDRPWWKELKKNKYEFSLAQSVNDPALSLLWHRFNPWTKNFHMPQGCPPPLAKKVCMYVCIYVFVCVCVYSFLLCMCLGVYLNGPTEVLVWKSGFMFKWVKRGGIIYVFGYSNPVFALIILLKNMDNCHRSIFRNR